MPGLSQTLKGNQALGKVSTGQDVLKERALYRCFIFIPSLKCIGEVVLFLKSAATQQIHPGVTYSLSVPQGKVSRCLEQMTVSQCLAREEGQK